MRPCALLQGAVLQSSDRGGIRIQYSRNPFGKKRDYGSFNDQSPYSPSPMAPASYQATPEVYFSSSALCILQLSKCAVDAIAHS